MIPRDIIETLLALEAKANEQIGRVGEIDLSGEPELHAGALDLVRTSQLRALEAKANQQVGRVGEIDLSGEPELYAGALELVRTSRLQALEAETKEEVRAVGDDPGPFNKPPSRRLISYGGRIAAGIAVAGACLSFSWWLLGVLGSQGPDTLELEVESYAGPGIQRTLRSESVRLHEAGTDDDYFRNWEVIPMIAVDGVPWSQSHSLSLEIAALPDGANTAFFSGDIISRTLASWTLAATSANNIHEIDLEHLRMGGFGSYGVFLTVANPPGLVVSATTPVILPEKLWSSLSVQVTLEPNNGFDSTLVSGTSVVPEPPSVILLGAGLILGGLTISWRLVRR